MAIPLQLWGFAPVQRKPSLGGTGALCNGSTHSSDGTGISLQLHPEVPQHPERAQVTNTTWVTTRGHQVSLGAAGRKHRNSSPFLVLETGGRFCQIPNWNNLAECPLPTLTARTADTFQIQNPGWSTRIWNHFLLQESKEGGTSIPAAKGFPAMH